MAFVMLEPDPRWRDLQGRFARAPQQVSQLIALGVRSISEAVLGAVVPETPSKTGKLRAAWHIEYGAAGSVTGGASARVVNRDPKSLLVLFGTRAHIIEPHSARALAFPGPGGRTVFARHVHHPGTRPNDFIGRGLSHLGLTARIRQIGDDIVALLRVGP